MIIRTANTETQSAVGHVPKERFENPSRGIRHTVRAQLAQYENAIGRSEWIIGRHHAVAVGAGTNQSAMGYGKLFRHPTAVRRGVGGFRVAQHLHRPATLDKQAETAGRERDDAHIGEWAERFWDGLQRRRVVLLSTAGELDVAVDRDDASDSTQSEAVVRIRRIP